MEPPRFEFNAPMFADFESDLDNHPGLDNFFFNTNNAETSKPEIASVTIKKEVISPRLESSDKRKSLSMNSLQIKEEVKSPIERNNKRRSPRSITRQNTALINDETEWYRSRSRSCTSARKTEILNPSNHEEILNQAIEGLSMSARKKKPNSTSRKSVFGGIQLDSEVASACAKEHPMTTRRDKIIRTPKLVLRSRSVVKDAVENAEDSSASRKRKSLHALEQLYSDAENNQVVVKKSPTDANYAQAPLVKVPKRVERHNESEQSENQRALQSTCPLPRKSAVQFREVKFEPKKPETASDSRGPYNFTAKAETGTLFPSTRKRLLLTEPKTPQLRTARRSVLRPNNRVAVIDHNNGVQTIRFHQVQHSGVPRVNSFKLSTQVKPFSFEERDRQMLQRKEEKIKQFYEEEKKKAEFHANPLPPFISEKKEIPIPSTRGYTLSRRSVRHKFEQSDKENPIPVPFKAQPPSVLHKDPFIPKKADRKLEISDFELKTEKRAREREQFEVLMKEKEAEKELAMREREMERKRQEEMEIARMRQEAVHKAQPIPPFHPPTIRASLKPLTQPMSPKFSSRFMNRKL